MRYDLHDQAITNTTLLERLSKLIDCTELILRGNKISQFPAEMFKELKILDLRETDIVDLTFLKHLPKLEELYLSDTEVNDISPLQFCPHLKKLYLTSTPIENIQIIGQLRELKELSLSDTQIGPDLSPLKTLGALENLSITNTNINYQSLLGLDELNQLTVLKVDTELESTRDVVLRKIKERRLSQAPVEKSDIVTQLKSFDAFHEEFVRLTKENPTIAMECLVTLLKGTNLSLAAVSDYLVGARRRETPSPRTPHSPRV